MAHRVDTGGRAGGIFKLLDLIEEHPAELTYDFRERFGLSLAIIGDAVTYREALLLLSVLMRDPSSWIRAAVNGWKFPVSREWTVLAHTYDLHSQVNAGKKNKPKPYPNPFPPKNATRTGNTSRPTAEVIDLLARMNPKEPDHGN